MKTILINLSDIHYGSNKPDNEGLVLSAFIKDVKEQVAKMTYDNIFVLIGGDLVFAASDDSYKGFDDSVIKKLMNILQIERDHFIIVPGNHDLRQSFIGEVEESFIPIVKSKFNEEKFNDLLQKSAQQNTLLGKFSSFKTYVKDTMKIDNYPLTCGVFSINDTWSVHTLNTAILSCGGYNHFDDNGHLGVDTRTLHKNLNEDKHPCKILLMHHPEYYCMDWVKTELKKLYHTHFDLILSGHTHDQELYCQQIKERDYIHCEAPQLFTDKHDEVLGYCFIEINDEEITQITYREWFAKRNKFRPGLSFTDDTDDATGIVTFESKNHPDTTKLEDDKVLTMMQMRLRQAMEAFVGQPFIWVERYLSDDRIDQLFSLTKSTLYSETDIINYNENVKIVAPSQYGLTCYGIHFLQTLWETKHEFGIMIDADGLKSRKFEREVESELSLFQKIKEDVKWIVIDNWRPYKKDQNGISKYIIQEFPDAHVLLLSPFHEHDFNEHANMTEVLTINKMLYLTPLKHEQERLIVDEFNKSKFIDESDIVLGKMDADIKDFNMHRTPYNCFALLTVFKDAFDKNPINRTSVIERILSIIFDNTKLPTYKNSNPDLKDCEFFMGYFCSKIINNEYYFFTRDYFYSIIKEFSNQKQIAININQLFDILCYNKILIEDSGEYTFRFTFWVYYFVASWMHIDEEFAQKILSDRNYQHYPEVLEFYTGKDRKRIDALKVVSQDLRTATKMVQQKIKIQDDSNPFAKLHYRNNSAQTEKIIETIDASIEQSNLPQEIKDQVIDFSFQSSAAFNQNIFKVYSDFSVGYLVNMISIASKVLRNSDQLDAMDKQELLSEITNALKVFSNIIYLFSRVFAKLGYIHLPDYSLRLSDEFNRYEELDKRIQIIVMIPYNLMRMFKDDLYSRKLSPVYIEQLKTEKDKVKKHLLAALIVYKQPEGWEPAIRDYVDSIGQNSYYLGTIIGLMNDVYSWGELDMADRRRMNYLIKSAYYKADHGKLPPSPKATKYIRLEPQDGFADMIDYNEGKSLADSQEDDQDPPE